GGGKSEPRVCSSGLVAGACRLLHPPERGRAIAYGTTFRFVIPAERRQAREPGPKNPCLGLISDAGILGSRIGSLRSPSGMTTRKAAKKSYAIALPFGGGIRAARMHRQKLRRGAAARDVNCFPSTCSYPSP